MSFSSSDLASVFAGIVLLLGFVAVAGLPAGTAGRRRLGWLPGVEEPK